MGRNEFLSTLSLRRATCGCCARCRYWAYFYPRSPCGERRPHSINYMIHTQFLSTLSLRRATKGCRKSHGMHAFLSTLSLRRATGLFFLFCCCIIISIHALLAESDYLDAWKSNHVCGISIHALLAESDINRGSYHIKRNEFLSTLSLRRATNDAINGCNPDIISIHALLAESDGWKVTAFFITATFLSTLSLRRAT